MARPTRRLIRRIGEDFALEDAAAVLDQLREVPECLPLGELQDPERIQASLVLPSAGDLGKFLSQLELAREDWRDALVVAGLGGSDWPAKLNEALGRPRIGDQPPGQRLKPVKPLVIEFLHHGVIVAAVSRVVGLQAAVTDVAWPRGSRLCRCVARAMVFG